MRPEAGPRDEVLLSAKILIVDDEAANTDLLKRVLSQVGYRNVKSTMDSRTVVALYTDWQPDLILLDLHMPHLDGFALMERLRPLMPAVPAVPILVLTADVATETKQRALRAGAKDFLTKPLDLTEVILRIRNLLETRVLAGELQTQNQRLEETVRERTAQLLQSEKVAAMGSLLAGVAHELNNPLAVVVGQAALLRHALGDGAMGSRAEKIVSAAERCARIVKNFLALARQRPPERQAVQLNQIVREAVELLAYPLRVDDVEVCMDPAHDLPSLWGDPHQLHQVIVNLITNAHHAMRDAPPPRRLTLTTRADPARVRLEVADTGPGIPHDVQRRIFEPFFTTKPPGVGTGLGLSLCQGIVEGHGGSIRAESNPPTGAVFLIELPVDSRRTARPEGRETDSPLPIRGKAILVVDDERDVADTLAAMLSVDDHRVDTAADGALALEKLDRQRFDAILSDLRMPTLDGPGLYRELERRHPHLLGRLIFLTGDTLSLEIREFLERTEQLSLSKPFTLEEVRRVVQRALGGAENADR